MKIFFVSLGCDKNLVDTEQMLGMLYEAGYTFTDDETEAEIIIVNTCCFIGDAKEESIRTILELARQKEEGKCRALLATGCLTQRYQKEFLEELPEVDGILGTNSYDHIVEALSRVLAGEKVMDMVPLSGLPQTQKGRILTTGGHYGFLKIAEGCNKRCTYCIIPSVRGNYRSVPMEILYEQAEELAGKGVKELILVAQETTLYGVDLYGEKRLPQLLKGLGKIPGIHWIRLLYCYPEEITDELIEVIKTEPKVCLYLDIPIQHGSDRILKKMGRKTSQKAIRQLIEKLRREIPDICLRTTLMTGFPGETEEDHQENIHFIQDMKFDRLGVFTYSLEEGTPAAGMTDQVEEEIKKERRDELYELQQKISAERLAGRVGTTLEVLIEGKVTDEYAYVGRTYMDAPGVDGYLFIQSDKPFMTGDFVRAKVTAASEYDLIGEWIP